jgi:hypothetical protein
MTEAPSAHFLSGIEAWFPVLVPVFLVAYFIPFFVATGRKHRFGAAIGLINLFLGWTVLGWVAAMIWAVNRDIVEAGQDAVPTGPMFFVNEPQLNERPIWAESQPVESADTKKCPHCAELVKAQAVVCRYCGRDIGSATTAMNASGVVTASSLDEDFEALRALLTDHEDAAERRFTETPPQPATNYESSQESTAPETEKVSADAVRELSAWKKFG